MADEPISALSNTFQYGYNVGNEVEVLDVADTTFASSGTNKRITIGTLLEQYIAAGTGVTVTQTGAGVTIASTCLSPTGSGAGLTGITAGQIGSVPAGVLKGSGGAIAAATAGTDYLTPTGSGAGLTGVVLTAGGYTYPSWLTAISGSIITTGTVGASYLTALGASGSGHSAGICPDPGSSAGTAKFLREDATWALPPNSVNGTTSLASSQNLTLSLANVSGFYINLPAAGTYEITGWIRITLSGTPTSIGQTIYATFQLYDQTNSNVVPNSLTMAMLVCAQETGSSFSEQQSSPIGPVFYTVSGPATIYIQAKYGGSVPTISTYQVTTDSNGYSILSYKRIY